MSSSVISFNFLSKLDWQSNLSSSSSFEAWDPAGLSGVLKEDAKDVPQLKIRRKENGIVIHSTRSHRRQCDG